MCDIQERLFRLSWLFYATAWIFLLAATFLIGLHVYLERTDGFRLHHYFSLILVVPAIVNFALVHHWRMRLDADGIHRRRLLWWRSYVWSEFGQGDVNLAESYAGFIFPNRPWSLKKLSFATLSEDGCEYAMTRCMEVWVPPSLPEIPTTLEIAVLNDFYRPSRLLTFDASGVSVHRRKRSVRYNWPDLGSIKIARYPGQTVGFGHCWISVPGLPLHLTNWGRGLDWRGPEPEIVAGFFEKNVPPEYLSIKDGRPQNLEEANSQLECLRERFAWEQKVARMFALGCFAVGVGSAVYALGSENLFDAAAGGLGAAVSFLFAVLFLCTPGRFKQKIAEAEDERRHIVDDGQHFGSEGSNS